MLRYGILELHNLLDICFRMGTKVRDLEEELICHWNFEINILY